jgi:outer membrane receptor for ferrienterochelin and colicin
LAIATTALSATAQAAESGVLSYEPAFFADSRPNTALDMVNRLPGFSLDNGNPDNADVTRGFGGTAGNVLIDGRRPTSKTDSLNAILKRMPADDVARIDVIRGGAPGIDMQGRTVVANIIRRNTNSTKVVATVENRFFLKGRSVVLFDAIDYTHRSGERTYEASLAAVPFYDDSSNGRGRQDILDPQGSVISHADSRYDGHGTGIAVKGGLATPLFDGELISKLTVQTEPFKLRSAYDSPTSSQSFTVEQRYPNGEISLTWTRPFESTELEALLLQSYGRQKSIDASDDGTTVQEFDSTATSGESIARVTLRYRPTTTFTLESGGEGAFNFLRGDTSFAVNGAPVVLPSSNASVEERRGEVFSQADWKLSDRWVLSAGARLEYSTIVGKEEGGLSRSFFYPKPRVVLTWTPNKDTQVRARYEQVVGQIDFNNFLASADLRAAGVFAGNADLRPDRRRKYELSFERHFWDGGAFVLTLLHEDITDVVDFKPVTNGADTFETQGNIGNGRNEQIVSSLTLPLDRIHFRGGRLQVNQTWNFSDVRDPTTGEHRRISNKRPQDVVVSIMQDITRLKSTWGIEYFNGWDEWRYRLTEVRHRRVSPPYLIAYWDYKPSAAWSFSLLLDNIARYEYWDRRDHYAGPRGTSPLVSSEIFTLHSQRIVRLQIRKTFD